MQRARTKVLIAMRPWKHLDEIVPMPPISLCFGPLRQLLEKIGAEIRSWGRLECTINRVLCTCSVLGDGILT